MGADHFSLRSFRGEPSPAQVGPVILGWINEQHEVDGAVSFSGGEAQRVKLATELSRRATGKTLYLIDEPTTGLSFYDVHKLMDVIQRLVDKGNSIICIEHNLDVIRCSDWIIDLGPEGGDKGGEILVTGTPEEVAQHPTSHTGRYLARVLEQHPPELPVPLAA